VIELSEPVGRALSAGRAVVALETSVLAQGLPAPRNLEVARSMSAVVRDHGAEPAWIWVGSGAIRAGATDDELQALASQPRVAKVARRDLPMAVAGGGLGATTVSATVWVAHKAGIHITATGGIGGVHPGFGDVSADLWELARTPGILVCSGPKSIVDPLATMERLEELGVALIGYRCGRLPFFLVRETEITLEHRADEPDQVAGLERARRTLGIDSTLVLCNPIPAEHAMDTNQIRTWVEDCQAHANAEGIVGKDATPYLLACLADRSGGATVDANVALLESNAALAARVATAL
jgi:pseudouridine-5'-phosphate glycosidase